MDQKVIEVNDRNENFLQETVRKIVYAICDTELELRKHYPALYELSYLDRNVSFISSQELEDMYPNLSSKERENAYLKELRRLRLEEEELLRKRRELSTASEENSD